MRIAIISDTHGLLRPEIFPHLEGVDHIVHAGDVGGVDILIALEAVAPVTAVWGNTDGFELRQRLPEVADVSWEGLSITVLHGHQLGFPTPEALAERHPESDLVVYGHTHRARVSREGTILTVNPGSCGPQRYEEPPSIVIADLSPEGIRTRFVNLLPGDLQ